MEAVCSRVHGFLRLQNPLTKKGVTHKQELLCVKLRLRPSNPFICVLSVFCELPSLSVCTLYVLSQCLFVVFAQNASSSYTPNLLWLATTMAPGIFPLTRAGSIQNVRDFACVRGIRKVCRTL